MYEGNVDLILYGGGRHGAPIAHQLEESGWRVMVVDLDPDALEQCRRHGLEVIYGDAEDPEFVLSLPLDQVRWVVSTVPGLDINLALLRGRRAAGYEGRIGLTARNPLDAQRLHEEEIDLVIAPFAVAADQLVDTLLTSAPEARVATEDKGVGAD